MKQVAAAIGFRNEVLHSGVEGLDGEDAGGVQGSAAGLNRPGRGGGVVCTTPRPPNRSPTAPIKSHSSSPDRGANQVLKWVPCGAHSNFDCCSYHGSFPGHPRRCISTARIFPGTWYAPRDSLNWTVSRVRCNIGAFYPLPPVLPHRGAACAMAEETLKADFTRTEPLANRLLVALTHEIDELLKKNGIALGVPLEGRVKTWTSLEDKLERKLLAIKSAAELDDLVGLRVILLFRSDLDPVLDLLTKTFDVLSNEDTASRLAESQFGYQSRHLVLRIPATWSRIPSLSDLGDLRAEVQVRTVAQHIWAAASHKLQYKQEESVPTPLKRTIYRISRFWRQWIWN